MTPQKWDCTKCGSKGTLRQDFKRVCCKKYKMYVNSGTKVGEREICLLNNIKRISVIKPQTCRVVPTVVAVWSDSRLLSQLLHGDPAEKPCLRPFLPSSSPLICLSVCLASSCTVLISRRQLCPYAAHTEPGDAQVIKVTRAHTEFWGQPK